MLFLKATFWERPLLNSTSKQMIRPPWFNRCSNSNYLKQSLYQYFLGKFCLVQKQAKLNLPHSCLTFWSITFDGGIKSRWNFRTVCILFYALLSFVLFESGYYSIWYCWIAYSLQISYPSKVKRGVAEGRG